MVVALAFSGVVPADATGMSSGAGDGAGELRGAQRLMVWRKLRRKGHLATHNGTAVTRTTDPPDPRTAR